MRFTALGLLALPLLAAAAPAPWQVSITVNEETSPAQYGKGLTPLSEEIPTFEDSRIRNHPDKKLLERIRYFFKVFTTGDFDGMRDAQSEDYTMTDIPISVIRASRDQWYEINKQFVSLMTDLKVIAVTLDGTSEPGGFSILEHVVLFKLVVDPPEQAKPNLPAGAKPGDWVGMVNLSVLYWDDEGKMSKEYEYGRLSWKDFDVSEFDKKTKSYLKDL